MRRSQRGQTGTEYMLVIAVIVVAVVAAAWAYIPSFQAGTEDLGNQVEAMLRTGSAERNAYTAASDGIGRTAPTSSDPLGFPASPP